jgi:NAD(P)-dependent dehydrogenase (short-subunit alcohol dehydrogenase family)
MGVDVFRLDGRVALITGGSKGLGKAIAESLAGAGASVALVSRHMDQAEAAARELRDRHRSHKSAAIGLEHDVSVSGQVDAMVARTLDAFGRIDILVNNAGTNIRGPVVEFRDEDWQQVLATNLSSAFYCCRAVGRHMLSRGGPGRVINLASIMAITSMPGRVAYAASKAGLIGLTKTLALEWAPNQITVNALCPGPFATEMNIPLLQNPEVRELFTSRIPLGRWGNVEEIGAAALYLASDAAAFVTGHTLYVDGGWTAQ